MNTLRLDQTVEICLFGIARVASSTWAKAMSILLTVSSPIQLRAQKTFYLSQILIAYSYDKVKVSDHKLKVESFCLIILI